jgi:hypothetical protein
MDFWGLKVPGGWVVRLLNLIAKNFKGASEDK